MKKRPAITLAIIACIVTLCNGLAPAFPKSQHDDPTIALKARRHPKQYKTLEQVMSDISNDSPMESDSLREKRDTDESGATYNTMDFYDLHNYALPVYTGILNSEVIFLMTFDLGAAGTVSSYVYRSADYGKTFTNITAKIGDGTPLVASVYISPTNHRRVYFIDAASPILYISDDEGVTFRTVTISPMTIDPYSITPHSYEQDWFLAQDPVNNDLYVSRDLGQTPCTMISNNVTSDDRYQWGEYPYDPDNSTVYFLSNKLLYSQQYPYDMDNNLKRFGPSDLEFNDILVIDRYFFLEYITNASTYDLWMSADRNPFQRAKIPTDLAFHEQYIVSSLKALQALVIIRHGNQQYNLYLSDETGVYFSESLPSLAIIEIIPNAFYYIDLAIGMNFTTYVANQIVGFNLRTLISYNGGGEWHTITAPDSDTNCAKPFCSLHFHMDTSHIWRTFIFMRNSAPGIILALGGTGAYFNASLGDLYISRDGGRTWTVTLEGLWQVDLIDHGSVIVATPYYRSEVNGSTILMYSCDEGDTWSNITYTDLLVHNAGIRTEPGQISTSIILFGVHPDTFSWVISVVDFMNIFDSDCGSDDYYNWMPYNEYADNGCLLGSLITIERRKQDVCCRNTHTYVRVVDYATCSCSAQDYQCDYGYKPISESGGGCIRDDGVTFESTCTSRDDYYTQSMGYRKIGGDVCSGGIERSLLPSNLSCSSAFIGSNNSSCSDDVPVCTSCSDSRFLAPFVIMLILLLIAIAVIVGLIVIIFVMRGGKSNPSGGTKSSPFHHDHMADSSSEYSVNVTAGGSATGDEKIESRYL